MTYNRILLAAVGRDLVAKFPQELEAAFLQLQVVVDHHHCLLGYSPIQTRS